jgi:hypothetical protein
VLSTSSADDSEWLHIKMPEKSYFMGFNPPNDKNRWKDAIDIAISGKLVLLEKVMEQIPYPEEIVSGDTKFGWLQRMSDLHVSQKRHPEHELKYHKESLDRAPIMHIGYREFHDSVMNEGIALLYFIVSIIIVMMIILIVITITNCHDDYIYCYYYYNVFTIIMTVIFIIMLNE